MDYFKLLRLNLEHQSLVSFSFAFFLAPPSLFLFFLFCFHPVMLSIDHLLYQGNHIAEATEARCSREVLSRDEALGALKEEVETLAAENMPCLLI